MSAIHIDFETRSTVDLKKAGVHVYAAHPHTDVWCMAYAVDAGPVELWTPDDVFCPFALKPDDLVYAHNASFELAIWNGLMAPRYGWPPLPIPQVRCTMVMAYALGLPGGLEQASAAVGLDAQKDMDGRRLMLQLSAPRRVVNGVLVWWDDPAKLEKLYAYCRQDVVVERSLGKRLLPLSPDEQALWELDQEINNRGLYVDLRAIDVAQSVISDSRITLDNEMVRVTGGNVTACSKVSDLTDWIKNQGVAVDGVAKSDVSDLLARGDLPANVRRALELRRDAAKSSTAKLAAMKAAAGEDNRVRGTLQFHGAATGRWAGRRVQTQNFPRPGISQEEIDQVFDILAL